MAGLVLIGAAVFSVCKHIDQRAVFALNMLHLLVCLSTAASLLQQKSRSHVEYHISCRALSLKQLILREPH